jgi:hypothetical protein
LIYGIDLIENVNIVDRSDVLYSWVLLCGRWRVVELFIKDFAWRRKNIVDKIL